MPKKKKNVKRQKPVICRICGIFDTKKKEFVYVNSDIDQTELEYDLEGYDDDRYQIIEFDLAIS